MGNETIKKAGWVVRDGKKFFVVKRSVRDSYTDISLPKWHIDLGENSEETALREVLEETGLGCQILWDLWTVMYWNSEWLVEVKYFAMKVKQKISDEIFPDVDEVITGDYDKISNLLSYDTDKIIFEKWARFFGCIK